MAREIKISFSQATTFNQCERRWALRYLYEIPSIPGPALVHGKKVHEEIEDYLNNKVLLVDPESIGMKAKQYIEKECTDTFDVEAHLQYEEQDITLHGYADVILKYCDGRKSVLDWKTSKKTPKQMKPEHQAQLHLYGFMAELRHGDKLTIAYPEYEIAFDTIYDPDFAKEIVAWMFQIAYDIQNIYEKYDKETPPEIFPARTGPLCGWCDYLQDCEEGKKYIDEEKRIKIEMAKRRK